MQHGVFFLRKCPVLWIVTTLFIAMVLAGVLSPREQAHPDEIVLAAARDLTPGEKDPYYISSIAKVWEPLIGTDDDGHIRGCLAESWESSEDCTRWRFKLRRGIRFQDGEPFNAAAVVQNYRRWERMGYRSSTFYGFLLSRVYPGYQEIRQIGDYEVEMRFDHPQPMLIYQMINFSSPIFSPRCFDVESGDFTGYAVGTGPFAIVDRKPGQWVLLRRFEGYHGDVAKSEYIRLVSMPNTATRFSALKAEEILGVVDIGAMAPSFTLELLRDPRFAVSANRNTINQYLTVNQEHWPFSDGRMIRAISLLMDREAIVRHYFHPQSEPTVNLLNFCNPFAKTYPVTRDEAEAVRLAAAVMGGERYPAKLLIPQYGLSRYSYKEVAEYLQMELQKLGIDLRILILDSATHGRYTSAGNYDFSLGTRGMANYAPESLLQGYMTAEGRENKLYHIGYKNEEAEEIFRKLPGMLDMAERRALYDRLQDIAVAAPPLIPIDSDYNVVVYNQTALTGYGATTYGVTIDKIARR
ncbi:MAG: ABC transporter substrate-binding protein [Schwartzia sp. (in: firmicutes)]